MELNELAPRGISLAQVVRDLCSEQGFAGSGRTRQDQSSELLEKPFGLVQYRVVWSEHRASGALEPGDSTARAAYPTPSSSALRLRTLRTTCALGIVAARLLLVGVVLLLIDVWFEPRPLDGGRLSCVEQDVEVIVLVEVEEVLLLKGINQVIMSAWPVEGKSVVTEIECGHRPCGHPCSSEHPVKRLLCVIDRQPVTRPGGIEHESGRGIASNRRRCVTARKVALVPVTAGVAQIPGSKGPVVGLIAGASVHAEQIADLIPICLDSRQDPARTARWRR